MNYKEALEFAESGLYGHYDQEEYMKKLLMLFQNPQKDLKIIHIAGTNGKGTTGFFLSHLLRQKGIKVGHFSSPHISDYRERMKIDGEMIGKDEFIKACQEAFRKKEDILQIGRWPTYFEMSLLIALLAFRKKTDYLILETGIGGREDATNQVDQTVLSIITTIGLDHTQMLGSSLEEIASHKAGIIKENVPVVSFTHERRIDEVIKKEAFIKNSPLYFVKADEKLSMEKGKAVIHYEGQKIMMKDYGLQQGYNANLAIKAYEILMGEKLKELKILEEISFEGRMEKIYDSPAFLIDGAHNEEGIRLLAENIGYLNYNKLILILGTMSDKEIRNFNELVDLCDLLILTRLEYERAQSPEKILNNYKNDNLKIYYRDSLQEAIDLSFEEAEEEDLILCTGSLYLIGAVRDTIQSMK